MSTRAAHWPTCAPPGTPPAAMRAARSRPLHLLGCSHGMPSARCLLCSLLHGLVVSKQHTGRRHPSLSVRPQHALNAFLVTGHLRVWSGSNIAVDVMSTSEPCLAHVCWDPQVKLFVSAQQLLAQRPVRQTHAAPLPTLVVNGCATQQHKHTPSTRTLCSCPPAAPPGRRAAPWGPCGPVALQAPPTHLHSHAASCLQGSAEGGHDRRHRVGRRCLLCSAAGHDCVYTCGTCGMRCRCAAHIAARCPALTPARECL